MIPSKQAERSIFEAIRLEVIANGFLPDITASIDANTWELARAALKATLIKPEGLVDVFGVGSPEGRNEKLMHRIVIDREGSVPGTIGGAPSVGFDVTGGTEGQAGATYKKVMLPTLSEDVTYEISIITNHITMDRIMRAIVKNVLKNRYYLQTVDDNGDLDGNAIFIEFLSEMSKTVGEDMHRSLRYVVYDLYDENDVDIRTGIKSMDTIGFEITPTENSIKLEDLNSQGSWNANTNTPPLADNTGTKDDYYAINTAGTQNLGSGDIAWVTSDINYHDGIKWTKLNN